MTYTQHRDTQETLTVLDTLDLDTEKPSDEEIAKRFGFEDEYYAGSVRQQTVISMARRAGTVEQPFHFR